LFPLLLAKNATNKVIAMAELKINEGDTPG